MTGFGNWASRQQKISAVAKRCITSKGDKSKDRFVPTVILGRSSISQVPRMADVSNAVAKFDAHSQRQLLAVVGAI